MVKRVARGVAWVLLAPIGVPSKLECVAFAVVGCLLARALGFGDRPFAWCGVALGVVYVLGLLRLALDALVPRKGE